MRTSNTTKLLSMLLLTFAFGVVSSARAQSSVDKSASPSPVRTNALAIISEIEKPTGCPADGTEAFCLAQTLQARLDAALAGLKTIVRIDEQREGIISDMQARIDIRGGIIDDLKKVDTNSQRIDTIGQDTRRIMDDQHRDDKETIGDLQRELDSCRSNQKWIALVSGAGGAYLGYRYGKQSAAGNSIFSQNPFQQFQAAPANFSMFQTTTEERVRQALKQFGGKH